MSLEELIKKVIKESRQPKRIIEGSELDGKIIYKHKTEQEIVDMFINEFPIKFRTECEENSQIGFDIG